MFTAIIVEWGEKSKNGGFLEGPAMCRRKDMTDEILTEMMSQVQCGCVSSLLPIIFCNIL